MPTGPALAAVLDRLTPDLLIIDAADFPSCCFAALAHIPRDRVIVIGPEPDPAYPEVALSSEMRRVLGCRHDPCPPGHHPRPQGALHAIPAQTVGNA